MNSLELFNQIYTLEEGRVYSKSLLSFFESTIRSRLPDAPRILDLGCGSKSVFEDITLPGANITAIDFSPVAISKALAVLPNGISYKEVDLSIPDILEKSTYDLIFDSHCLHCITDEASRKAAFTNIYQALRPDGLFTAEMMVLPPNKTVVMANKHVVDARMIEEEILSYGFKINYFLIVRDLVFGSENGDCDLVRVILRK